MVALGGGVVSYEPGTPVLILKPRDWREMGPPPTSENPLNPYPEYSRAHSYPWRPFPPRRARSSHKLETPEPLPPETGGADEPVEAGADFLGEDACRQNRRHLTLFKYRVTSLTVCVGEDACRQNRRHLTL